METQQTSDAVSIEANTNLARSCYDSFLRGDLEELLSKYTDDVDWEVYGPSTLPTAGPYHGKEQLQSFFVKVNELLESNRFDIQNYVAQGDTVVAIGEYNWTSKVTGKEFEASFVHVVTIRDGRVCKFREYTDTAKAVAAMTA